MAQLAKVIKLLVWSSLIGSLAVHSKSLLPVEGLIAERGVNGDELTVDGTTGAFEAVDTSLTPSSAPSELSGSSVQADRTYTTEQSIDADTASSELSPVTSSPTEEKPAETTPKSNSPLNTDKSTTALPKKHELLLVDSPSQPLPCKPHLCDAESTLVITLEPPGNDTGFVSRALGLPVHFECALYTQGRRVNLSVEWLLPNGTQIVKSVFDINSVQVQDSGEYTCTLKSTKCCPHAQLSVKVQLYVYELSETAGIILMLSVLASIVVLVAVFCYSQKKKKYHTWLKHEILAAATSSSSDSTPHSTLRRDLNTNSKKYLLNS